MLQNYLKIAWRNLAKNKVYAAINIGGLAAGMTVSSLLGLWLRDELTTNRSFAHYNRLGQLYQHQHFNGHIGSHPSMPYPIGDELRTKYNDFANVAMASWNYEHFLAYKDRKLTHHGMHVEPAFTRMFSVQMLKGSPDNLRGVNSVLLSKTLADALFKTEEPMGRLIRLDGKSDLVVTGVYEDFGPNTTFADVSFLTPWAYFASTNEWVKNGGWGNNAFQCFVELHPQAEVAQVSAKVGNVIMARIDERGRIPKPQVFIHPMSRWHLYSDFREGQNVGGRIQLVWLFGIVGAFVLLLACINFMNLNTARSEKRAKEVGIRKAVGSMRTQLIGQFLSESVLMVTMAFAAALGLSVILLPLFNQLANKKLTMPWTDPLFWGAGLLFTLGTGLLAGSYPALYLSSFNPVATLKGTIRAGRRAVLPRRVLVVVQFTVSVALIIATLVVYQQINHVKNRPVGYERNGLLTVAMNTPDLYKKGRYDLIRRELLNTGVVANMSQASGPITISWSNNTGFNWPGKKTGEDPLFTTVACSHDHGQTIGYEIVKGRDFSRTMIMDSAAMVINESAAKLMGSDIIGKEVTWTGRKTPFHVIGIVKDIIMESPFGPQMPVVFMIDYDWANAIHVRIKPTVRISDALPRIASVFRQFNPEGPFEYRFVDQEFGKKFADEERVGQLATVFAILAIFISCLGLFGLTSFIAEQRTKEIGIRKVLGASVLNLWGLLSKDFVILVLIGSVIATPAAWYVLDNWLQNYYYRITISGWVFIATIAGTLLIALLTVSFQSVKAALMNPVKSLRSE